MVQTTTGLLQSMSKNMICLSVSYQGDAFKGIQVQPSVRTVAGVLQASLSKMVFHDVCLTMSGRTDASVHATRQVVAFPTDVSRPMSAYLSGVNNMLPHDIRINEACEMPMDFHPRFKAISRRYVYVLYKGRYLPSHWMNRAYAVGQDLDVAAMQKASEMLVGKHDFSSFRAAGCQAFSPVRTIKSIQFYETGPWVMMSIEADAFLYRMVRKIMKSLLSVGLKVWSEDQLRDVFHQKMGVLALPMKPDGLYFTDVIYAPEYARANRKGPCWLEQWMLGEKQ